MRDEGDGEADYQQPQCLTGKFEGPAGRTTGNRPCGTWPDIPSKTLLIETEVSRGGELDVENVEGRGTYLGAAILYLRYMIRIIHGRPTGT